MSKPQTECEWRECLDALQEAKNSRLSISGVTPMQLVFGRSPEILGNLLSDNPDLIANSSMMHDRDAGQAAKIRKIARSKHWTPDRELYRPSRRHGCSLALDEGRRHSRQKSTSPMETWNMHGRGARQLLHCTPRECHQGFSRTTETGSM